MRWWPFGGRGGRHAFGAAVTALPSGPLRLPVDRPAATPTVDLAPWSGDDDAAVSLADLLRGADDAPTAGDAPRWSPFDLGLDDEPPAEAPVEAPGAGWTALASALPADDLPVPLPPEDSHGLPVLTLLPGVAPGDDGRTHLPAAEGPSLSLLPDLRDVDPERPLDDAGLPDGPPRTADLPDGHPPVALPVLAVPGLGGEERAPGSGEERAPASGEQVLLPPSVGVPCPPLPPLALPRPQPAAPVPPVAPVAPPATPRGRSSAVLVPAPEAPCPVDPLPWLALPATPSTTPGTAPVAPAPAPAPVEAVPATVRPAVPVQQDAPQRDLPQAGGPLFEVRVAAPFVPTGPPALVPAGLLPLQRGESGPAPRVRLGFRDGSTADLPAGSESSRALEELARILLARS